MYKISLYFSLLLFYPQKGTKYLIITGDVSCKACVIEIYHYLDKKVKKENLTIALRDKGQLIPNESSRNYYQRELPKARFIFLSGEARFPNKGKYPYILKIDKRDTLKIPYDSLFVGEHLSTRLLD